MADKSNRGSISTGSNMSLDKANFFEYVSKYFDDGFRTVLYNDGNGGNNHKAFLKLSTNEIYVIGITKGRVL